MSTFDKLYQDGERLGFKRGGQVKKGKDTSGEFVQKKHKQDPMDHGVQPARKGRSQQEIEAGGTPKLKPKFKRGGRSAPKGAEKMAKKGIKKAKAAGLKKGGSC